MVQVKVEESLSQLEKLGFHAAANKVRGAAEYKRKLAIAYEHYRVVSDQKINEFNQKLYSTSSTSRGDYKVLSLTPIEAYGEVPPKSVLDSLEVAIGRQCFDSFQVAHIVQVKDPLLFGLVKGCSDHFFIDQWDDDIKISDLLKDNEG